MKSLYLLPLLAGALLACGEDESPAPVNLNFASSEVGISSAQNLATISLNFARPAESAGELTITLEAGNLTYGPAADFYTQPDAENSTIVLPYQPGSESVQFTVHSGSGLNIQQDQSINFTLTGVTGRAIIGSGATTRLTFSENFTAPGGTLTLNAGDNSSFSHQVFIDLSKQQQTRVEKYSWDLGFYTEAGEYYVVLNSPASTMARPIPKYDLNAVTAADTVGFGWEMQVGQSATAAAAPWVDTPDGNLQTTAFGEISANEAENRVFIVKREGNRNWQKVRVLREGNGYLLQYADIAATSYQTLSVSKDPTTNFSFVNLSNGAEVSVEPARTNWDLQYGTYTELFPSRGQLIPYNFNDFVVINRHGTRVATVFTELVSYEAFDQRHLAEVDFRSELDALGESWRVGGGPSSQPSLRQDRFYLIEDSEGNVYKLRFTRLTPANGERGKPEFEYQLVK
jgi:hypothetical protein